MQKIFTEKEIPDIAKEIIKIISSKSLSDKAIVVALSGELGAGKTTLTQFIARELGIKENVISPTFILIKNYEIKNKIFNKLVHIDAYRFEHENELLKLGWEELLANPKNLILIEWPEKVSKIIPKDVIWIKLEHKNEEERMIDIIV